MQDMKEVKREVVKKCEYFLWIDLNWTYNVVFEVERKTTQEKCNKTICTLLF